jgi:excisionase family DNA binding protein
MSERTTQPDVLTAEEAAGLLRTGVDKVRRDAASGAIPGRRVGGVWRFSRTALLSLLSEPRDVRPARRVHADRSDTFVPAKRSRFAGRI